MTGIYELINVREGTVTCWKTPELLRADLNKVADDFDSEWKATIRRYDLIKAALKGDRDLRTAGIVADAEDKANEAAAKLFAKIDGKTYVPGKKPSAAEQVELAKRYADQLRDRHGDGAMKAAHAELAEALGKLTDDRRSREEQHAEEVRKARHFMNGWYQQPAYSGNLVAMPTDKDGNVIERPTSPNQRRRLH